MNDPVPQLGVELAAADLKLLFPSPVMSFDWPASQPLNQRLRELVLARREQTSGVVKTNRGGWQSDADLQNWRDPAISALIANILVLAREYVARQLERDDPRFNSGWQIRAWANINEKNHFNRSHHHLGRESFFSGVYYIDVGDIDCCSSARGRTIFEDWTRVAIELGCVADAARSDVHMMPRNGRMLLFPASLRHSVEQYSGERPRITVAFNLYHPGFYIPRLEEYVQQSGWMWTNFRGLMVLRRKIPEKLFAFSLIPSQVFARNVPKPRSLKSWRAHLATAVSSAFALASERFEPRK